MINQIIGKIRGFLLQPVETFQKSRGDDAAPVMAYFAVLLIFYGLLSAIVSAAGVMMNPVPSLLKLGLGTADPVVTFFTVLFSVIIGWLFLLLIWGLWLHVFSYIAGARKGIMETEKAVIYGTTPFFLLGWIPVIGMIIGGIWAIILTIIGLRELHQITTGKARSCLCSGTGNYIRHPVADSRVARNCTHVRDEPVKCNELLINSFFFSRDTTSTSEKITCKVSRRANLLEHRHHLQWVRT